MDYLFNLIDKEILLALSSLKALIDFSQFDNSSLNSSIKKLFNIYDKFSDIEKHFFLNLMLELLEDNYRIVALKELN